MIIKSIEHSTIKDPMGEPFSYLRIERGDEQHTKRETQKTEKMMIGKSEWRK